MIRILVALTLVFLATGCELLGYSVPGETFEGRPVKRIYAEPANVFAWPADKPGTLKCNYNGRALIYQGACTDPLLGSCKIGRLFGKSKFIGVATASNYDEALGCFYSTDSVDPNLGLPLHFGPNGQPNGLITACLNGTGGLPIDAVLPSTPPGVTCPPQNQALSIETW